jgi:hypothetical protein
MAGEIEDLIAHVATLIERDANRGRQLDALEKKLDAILRRPGEIWRMIVAAGISVSVSIAVTYLVQTAKTVQIVAAP